jgi:tetratricopeptide (TPR) repeat protein
MSLTRQPVDTVAAARDPELDEALAGWSAETSPALAEKMRDRARQLGLYSMLVTLSGTTPLVSTGNSYALVAAVDGFGRPGGISSEDLLALAGGSEITDLHRIVAVIYACARPDTERSGSRIVLNLAARTSANSELAARCYFHYGLLCEDDDIALSAFISCGNKSLEAKLADLFTVSALYGARSLFRLGEYAEAANAAKTAREEFDHAHLEADARAASIIESAARSIEQDAGSLAVRVLPMVADDIASNRPRVHADGSMILEKCIKLTAARAMGLATTGDIKAVEAYESALALAANTGYRYPAEASDRIQLGERLMFKGQHDVGLRQVELAETLARGLRGSPRVLLSALLARTEYLVATEDKRALALTMEALTLAGELGEVGLKQKAELFCGMALRQSGQIDMALDHLARANEGKHELDFRLPWINTLFEAHQDSKALEVTQMVEAHLAESGPAHIAIYNRYLSPLILELLKRGYIAPAQRLNSLLQSASDLSRTVIEAMASGSGVEFETRAKMVLSIATAQLSAGEFSAAVASLVPLFNEAQAKGALKIELTAAYILGLTWLTDGQYQKSYEVFKFLAARAENVMPAMHATALTKMGTALVHLNRKIASRALIIQQQGIDASRACEDWASLVSGLVEAAITALIMGKPDQAKRFSDELQILGKKYPPQDREWLACIPARVASALGDWNEARLAFRAMIVELEDKRRLFKTADLQRNWGRARANFYGWAIQAAIEAGDAAEAVHYLELARNRYLTSIVRRDKFDAANWESTAASIAGRLPAGCAFVWCISFADGLGIVSAMWRGDQVALHGSFHSELGGSERDRLFTGADGEGAPFLEARSGETWNQAILHLTGVVGARLWPLILASIETPVAHIVLLPSFGCSELPLVAAAPEQWPDQTPLNVSFAPSMSSLAVRDRLDSSPPRSLVQIENPTEDAALVCCSLERRAVGTAFARAADVIRGRRANASRVADALANADIFHFMGHAWCDWAEPMNSGVLCAGGPSPTVGEGGAPELRVRDLLKAPRAIGGRLIVLSACEVSNVRPGDMQNDFVALPATLIALGARSVISPRWQVDDVAASMLVANVFQRWLTGGDPLATSLREARRWLREDVTRVTVEEWLQGAEANALDPDRVVQIRRNLVEHHLPEDHPFNHVRYWGAFELTGDPFPFGATHA